MIFFDLDGVLRNLCGLHCSAAAVWDAQIDGMGVRDYVDKHPQSLVDSEPTPYLSVVKACGSWINVISCQPAVWRPFTYKWLERHLGGVNWNVLFTDDSGDEKFRHMGNHDLIVEDYPFFTSYDQVILIDYPYNQKAKAPIRVNAPEQLAFWLKNYGGAN
jgi:hypothetical protein